MTYQERLTKDIEETRSALENLSEDVQRAFEMGLSLGQRVGQEEGYATGWDTREWYLQGGPVRRSL